MKTYDVHFNDSNDSNSKGFTTTIEDAKDYITSNNGTNHSYFSDYKGGTVSVVAIKMVKLFTKRRCFNARRNKK